MNTDMALTGFFLALFAAHVVHSLVTLREDPKHVSRARVLLHVALQTPLFLLACYFAVQRGVFSRQLVSPVYIGAGLMAGHLIFGVSLFITHRSLRDAWSYFFDFGSLWDFAVDSPFVLIRFLYVAVAEEMIYRVAAQPILLELLSSPTAAILIVAACFALMHRHFFQNSFAVGVEFLGFAILLGVLYYFTNSFILVVVIHALRDIEIAYLEYLMRVEELGDKELAAKELEDEFTRRRPEKS